ncbi:MAG: hypothetical protein ACRENI_03435 [Gemmatimonadaceae bacterium]
MTLVACAGDDGGGVAADSEAHRPVWRSAAAQPFPALRAAPYNVVEPPAPGSPGAWGSIAGTVELLGDPIDDNDSDLPGENRGCGRSAEESDVAQGAIERDGTGLLNVVVWLADIRTGRRLPLERRFELTNRDCMLVPRVQAVAQGGTLNVRNRDNEMHRTRFVRTRTGETLELLRYNDAGQVVPVESVLAERGLLEVRCDSHPWTLGWIAVFDHPYFAVTGRDGEFTIQGVPPGRYRLVAWHERLGIVEEDIEVKPGDGTGDAEPEEVLLRYQITPLQAP